jgi:HK97 gp10 family phage protein
MSDIDVRINVRDFNADLRDLGGRITKRVARNAVAAGARVIVPIAKKLAPVLRNTKERRRIPGTLRAGIYQKKAVPIPGGVSSTISVRSPRTRSFTKRAGIQTPFYWRFLEGGWIPRGPGKRIKGGERRRRETRAATAGGKRQFPFLAPALKQGGPAAVRKFEEIMDKGIAREQAKRGKSDV